MYPNSSSNSSSSSCTSSNSNSNPYPNWSRKTVCCWRSSLELITIFKYICADSYTQPEKKGRRTRMGPCVSCIQTSTWNIYYANIMPTTSYEHPDRCERKLTPLDKRRDGGGATRGGSPAFDAPPAVQTVSQFPGHKCLLTIKFTSLHLNLKHLPGETFADIPGLCGMRHTAYGMWHGHACW